MQIKKHTVKALVARHRTHIKQIWVETVGALAQSGAPVSNVSAQPIKARSVVKHICFRVYFHQRHRRLESKVGAGRPRTSARGTVPF